MPRVKTFLVGFFAAVALAAVMGQVQQPSRVQMLDMVTGQVDVTNTPTETALYSFSVPGGILSTNRMLRFTLTGFISTTTTNDSYSLRIKYGGTIQSIAADTMVAPTSGPYELVVYVVASGATNTQWIVGRYTRPTSATVVGGNTDLTNGTPLVKTSSNPGVVDSTAAQTFTVTLQWTGTLSTDHFSRQHATLEWLQ